MNNKETNKRIILLKKYLKMVLEVYNKEHLKKENVFVGENPIIDDIDIIFFDIYGINSLEFIYQNKS